MCPADYCFAKLATGYNSEFSFSEWDLMPVVMNVM